MQLIARICWIIIDLIKCNPIISSCVQINTLLFHLPLKALTRFQVVPLNRRSWAGSHCSVNASSGAASTRYVYTQVASSVPLHLKCCDLAEGCVLKSDVRLRTGKPGWSFRSSWFPRSGRNWGRVGVMIATWMFFSLFTVGLLGCLLSLWNPAGCPLRELTPLGPPTHEGTFPVIL